MPVLHRLARQVLVPFSNPMRGAQLLGGLHHVPRSPRRSMPVYSLTLGDHNLLRWLDWLRLTTAESMYC